MSNDERLPKPRARGFGTRAISAVRAIRAASKAPSLDLTPTT